MATTLYIATDEILSLLNEAWRIRARRDTMLTYDPELLWEISEHLDRAKEQKAFARASIRHTSGRQKTLAGVGNRRFRNFGVVNIQVITPFLDGTGAGHCQKLAEVCKDAYEGKRTQNVWFRGCRFQEIGRDGPWYQINLLIEFEWDEIK